ncbi:hypothetical protein RAS1_12320 [Phycisphaerae bacterium RAS1]|nr:hypothetical protein RAS1_12320 [Phycisphaerae bacterium RAS1]
MRPSALVLNIAVLIAAPPAAVAGDPLRLIPDESGIVVVCPNLDDLQQHVRSLGKALDVDDLADWQVSEMFDDIDLFDSTTGLDQNGALLIAISPDFQPLVICGLKEPDAWKAAVKARGDSGVLELRASGGDHYACIRDGFVAVAADEELIEAVLSTKGVLAERVRAQAEKFRSKRSVYVYIELPALRVAIGQGIELLLGFMQAGMQMAASGPDAEAGLQFWRYVFNLLRDIVAESESYAAALRLGEEGVQFEERVVFRKDGKFAAYLGRLKPAEAPLLRGLHDTGPLAVVGAEWTIDGKCDSALSSFMREMLSAESMRKRVGEKFDEAVRMMCDLYNHMSGYSSSFEMTADHRLRIQGYYYSADPAETFARLKRCFEISPELMAAQSAAVSCKVQTGVETVAGRECLRYDVEFATDDEAVRRVLETFYGSKMRIYVCQTDLGVYEVMADPESARAALTAALTKEAKPLAASPRVTEALARHTPRPQLIFMADAVRITDFGLKIAGKLGIPAPAIKWPDAPQPYVSYAGYLEPAAYRGELVIPIQPLQTIRKAIKSIEKPGAEKY